MNRFVLLCYNTTENRFHWDFLFEEPDACKTFSAAQNLVEEARKTGTLQCVVTPLADHRLAYLDHEGPVSGNRGFVKRLDFGTYRTIDGTIHFQGQLCKGTVDLRDDFLVLMLVKQPALTEFLAAQSGVRQS